MISTETKIVLLTARMRLRDWLGPRPGSGYPGRDVTLRFGYCEITRVYGIAALRTGARMRAEGWDGARIDRLRLVIPWRAGALFVWATR